MITAPTKRALVDTIARAPPDEDDLTYAGIRDDHHYRFRIRRAPAHTIYSLELEPRTNPATLTDAQFHAFIEGLGSLDAYLEPDAHTITRALATSMRDPRLRALARTTPLASYYGPWNKNSGIEPYTASITLVHDTTQRPQEYLAALLRHLPALKHPRILTRDDPPPLCSTSPHERRIVTIR